MDFDKFHLNLALDYGGLDELARGMRQVVEWIQRKVNRTGTYCQSSDNFRSFRFEISPIQI